MTDDRHISEEELALLAMQALSAEETGAVRVHLSECAVCREELAQIYGDLAVLTVGVAQHPIPEGARERFLDRINASARGDQPATETREISAESPTVLVLEPPETPVSETPATPRTPEISVPEKTRVVPISAGRETPGPDAPAVRSVPFAGILSSEEASKEAEQEQEEEAPRRQIPWLSWSAIAALLILSAFLGLRVHRLNGRVESDEARLQKQRALIQKQTAENLRARTVLDTLTAPSAQHVVLTSAATPPGPSARAVYLAFRGALILQASNLRQLPPNKTYEAWVIPVKGNPIPAGVFRPDNSGSGSVVLPEIPVGIAAKAFGITVENAGGSATPTPPILLYGNAPASGE